MKKISLILAVFALAMTMSQCKKNEEPTTSNDKVVTITLDVKNNDSSKVIVNTATGTVDFETGDKIYVGSGGKYVGFLTHNGTNFSGNITNPTENQPLQFYFLGNVTPQETLSAGTTEECSVIISDQTEHLPVISCAASNENFVSGVTAYSAHLLAEQMRFGEIQCDHTFKLAYLHHWHEKQGDGRFHTKHDDTQQGW